MGTRVYSRIPMDCADLFGDLPANEEASVDCEMKDGRGSWFGIEWVFPA
jgi:hypothetical protein